MSAMEKRSVVEDLKVSPSDGVIALARTLAEIVPAFVGSPFAIGSPLAELITAVFGSPVSKRRDKWLIYVVEGLEETKARLKDFDPENLKDNEQFISATLQATQIAIRNHQQEKLEALRNAVLNTAIGIDINETIQLMFIEAIDALTPLHLRTLKFFDNPDEYFQANSLQQPTGIMMENRSQILEMSLPEMKGSNELSKLVVNDLTLRGLLSDDSSRTSVTTGVTQIGPFETISSHLGKDFLRYISDPNE